MNRRQSGFTMIELIVVIIILGILAAVALPRFTNMQRDARVAKLNAARGAVTSAMAMVHGAAMARQNQVQPTCAAAGGFGANPPFINAAGSGNICTENGRVQVTFLYPSGNLAGLVASAGLVQVAGTPTAAQLATDGYQTAGGGAAFNIRVVGGPSATTCNFTYTQATAIGVAPTLTTNTITGC